MKRAKAALAASRASQRAAALAKRRGAAATQLSASSETTPEKLRGIDEDIALNITDAEGADGGEPSLDQTPEGKEELHARHVCARLPMPPSEAAEVQDFLYAWAVGGYDEKELEEGVRDRGGWRKVIFSIL